jgi:predicted deacylase
VHGILNVMNFLGMIRLKKAFHSTVASTIAKQSHWLRSSYSGLFKPSKQLGKVVKAGEKIAIIANPIGTEEYPIFSPLDGIIIGMTQMPMVHEGAALFNMASFKKLDMVEEHIDSLYEVYV